MMIRAPFLILLGTLTLTRSFGSLRSAALLSLVGRGVFAGDAPGSRTATPATVPAVPTAGPPDPWLGVWIGLDASAGGGWGATEIWPLRVVVLPRASAAETVTV